MKQKKSSLSVNEFTQMLEKLCATTSSELQQTQVRLEMLRDGDPPG